MYPHHFNNQNRMEYYSYNSISNLSKSDRRQWNKSNKEFSMDYADADVRETEVKKKFAIKFVKLLSKFNTSLTL